MRYQWTDGDDRLWAVVVEPDPGTDSLGLFMARTDPGGGVFIEYFNGDDWTSRVAGDIMEPFAVVPHYDGVALALSLDPDRY